MTDYSHILSIVVPVVTVIIYGSCFYIITDQGIGFIVMTILAWIVLAATVIVLKNIRTAYFYITAKDDYDCYKISRDIIQRIRRKGSDIILDDNIGVSSSIKIIFNKKKFSRKEMSDLVDEEYLKYGAEKRSNKVSMLEVLVYLVSLIFDISFLINIAAFN